MSAPTKSPRTTPPAAASTAAERNRQRAQLASGCRNAVAAMGDALTLLEVGDTDGARVALQNAIDATRADLIGAKARR